MTHRFTRHRRRTSSTSLTLRVSVLALVLILGGCRDDPDQAKPMVESAGPDSTDVKTSSKHGGDTSLASIGTEPISDPLGCLTPDCHANFLSFSYRHRPVLAGACDECHGPEQPDHQFSLKRAGQDMCTFCHPVIGNRTHLHQVIQQEGCLPCHRVHASWAKFLLTGPDIESTCRHCHPLEPGLHPHGPVATGQCTVCHEPHESNHPFLLRGGEGPAHCFGCHDGMEQELAAAPFVHKPVSTSCVECHDPHSSNHTDGLTAALGELCLGCHADVASQVTEASYAHGAIETERSCANCHDAHASTRPQLLRDDLLTLCLGCHDKPQEAYDGRIIPDMRPVLLDSAFRHGPVRESDCNACHFVHASRYTRLLRDDVSPEHYLPFDLADYALCFGCHDSAIVLNERDESVTGFRDGDQNLHYLHVNQPDKGRSCRACHEMHGSNLPGHLAETVPFEGGGWAMPIRFEASEQGGRCSPGCHEAMDYRRTLAPRPSAP